MSPAEHLVDRLSAKRNGAGWIAKCPAHDDRQPSLSINEGADGRVLLKCFAGCTTENIVAAIGLTMRDLFPNQIAQSVKANQHQQRRSQQRRKTAPLVHSTFMANAWLHSS